MSVKHALAPKVAGDPMVAGLEEEVDGADSKLPASHGLICSILVDRAVK